MDADSVGIDNYGAAAAAPAPAGGAAKAPHSVKHYASVKVLIGIFLIFILVVSDIFVNNVVSGFGEKAVRGRNPTAWGTVIQGIFLVLMYIIVVAMIEHKVL